MLSRSSRPRESTTALPLRLILPAVRHAMDRFEPQPPVVIGIVGGIAAGKSTVAALFAAAGLEHVDADGIARALVDEPAIRTALRARFGAAVERDDGSLDRAALARLVFADAAARRDLESITHPQIRARILAQIEAAKAAGRSVLLDAPLLLEGPLHAHCDAVVFVDASDAVRRRRALARGWSEAEWQRREQNQLGLGLKRARANASIRNDADLDATRRAVEELLSTWRDCPPRRSEERPGS